MAYPWGRNGDMPAVAADMAFVACWDMLASEGACDAPGSAECLRVYAAWRRAGAPLPPESFIREKANRPSNGGS